MLALVLAGVLAGSRGGLAAPAGQDGAFWQGVLEGARSRTDPEGGLLRAAAYVNLGRIVDALDEAERLSALAYQDVARVLVPRYEQAVAAAPDDVVALNCLAFGYYALDRMDEAIAVLRRLTAADSDNPWPRNLLAIALLTREQYAAARGAAEEALRLDPRNEYSHLILAYAYLHERDYVRFLAHYWRGRGAARELQQYLQRQASRASHPQQSLAGRRAGEGDSG